MAFVGFLGRLAFAFLFISSGLQKLQTFDKMTGGPLVTSLVEPALEKSLGEISTLIEQPIKFANIKVG